MKIEDLQSFFSAAILADPALAAFGAPLITDPFVADETIESLVGQRLREIGVLIEIGYPSARRTSDRNLRGTAAAASIDILVAESPTLAHTPTGLALQQRIIDAIQSHGNRNELNGEFESIETAVSEQGYILTAIAFTKAVIV